MRRALLAWILWSQTVPLAAPDSRPTWNAEYTYPTEQTCLDAARELERRDRNLVHRITFSCVPETLDPRPKT